MPITATPLQIAPALWSCANCGSQRYSRVTTTLPKPDSGRCFRLLERIALCQCYIREWDSGTRELKDSRLRAARSFSCCGLADFHDLPDRLSVGQAIKGLVQF